MHQKDTRVLPGTRWRGSEAILTLTVGNISQAFSMRPEISSKCSHRHSPCVHTMPFGRRDCRPKQIAAAFGSCGTNKYSVNLIQKTIIRYKIKIAAPTQHTTIQHTHTNTQEKEGERRSLLSTHRNFTLSYPCSSTSCNDD
jgi:hypothetical protein